MPDITISLTTNQISRLNEAWGQAGVPLQTSVLKALARVTKEELLRQDEEAAGQAFNAARIAARDALDGEFGAW